MTALLAPDEEECYLLALLDGDDGLDLAEFAWVDEEQDHGCYRAWDVQWAWYLDDATFQVDCCGRSVGKTVGVQMRAFAFPFNHPGQEMLITAPELNHLRPLVDAIEARLLSTRLSGEMMPQTKGKGIARQPHWQVRFVNNARIISRLPQKSGAGVKGQHPLKLEMDEAQDYPLAGWVELIETLKRGSKGAQWRCHGVPRGVRDKFYEITQPGSGWTVHRVMAMHRPSWSPEEREEKISTYGGSRQNPDYKRNIYGEHGDATNPVFVLARLMACVDRSEGSEYNADIFTEVRIAYEQIRSPDNPDGQPIEAFLDLPGSHKAGHEAAPKGYSAYYAGMDVGVTDHPSEILVFGQRAGSAKEHLDLLLRVHMQRIPATNVAGDEPQDTQEQVVFALFGFYGSKLKGFGIDKTGVGFPLWQNLVRHKTFGNRVYGYNFSENVAIGFEDREPTDDEELEDLIIWRNVVEFATDALRNDYVDPRKLTLPYNREVLNEWQGQNYTIVKSAGNPYGKRQYSQGKFHTLDAGKMAVAAKLLPAIQAAIESDKAQRSRQDPVFDAFVGV